VGRNLTTEEVAERYRTVPATVRYWKWVGKEPGTLGRKVGRHILFDEDALDRWDREQTAAQQSA
jgi:hypothetical protein